MAKRPAKHPYVAVFDFDHTLINQDIGEAALRLLSIPKSRLYEKLLKLNQRTAFLYCLQAYEGMGMAQIEKLFEKTFKKHFQGKPLLTFRPEMLALLKILFEQKARVHIVSASPAFLVRLMVKHGLNPLLKELNIEGAVALGDVHGLEALWEKGKLTSLIQFPLPMFEGKRDLLQAQKIQPDLVVGDAPGDFFMMEMAPQVLFLNRRTKPAHLALFRAFKKRSKNKQLCLELKVD